ncbi:MAG: zinc D-Ala-D-Ala carboxypeptidase, partial [Patescibacteria group bacterium]|nr:zinc D-Ala-D-Ala carboxypeptidase [Patescibacteria group bacterium]
ECYLEACFADTKDGIWLKDNAYKYGFILRYPLYKHKITGYQYEPWQFRYVGKYLSQKIYSQNTTLEEFFNL